MIVPLGERVGRYVVVARIGEGPRGLVYRATRGEGAGRPIALKLVAPMATVDLAKRVASARSAAALDHPNIAAVVEVGTYEGALFVARELIHGSPIGAHANASRGDRLRALIAVAGALHHAHTRGVVHGAVREGNVLVEEDGTLKVTDFAIGEAKDARDDRRGWIDLAKAILEETDFSASVREALEAAAGENGSLDRAASMLDAALDEPSDATDVPVDETFEPSKTTRPPITSNRSQVPRFVLVALIIAASLALLFATRRRPLPHSVPLAEAGVPAIPISTMGVPTQSPQALALFNGAMQSMHDASFDLAKAGLNEALRLDPSFAAAHLRRGLISIIIDDASREHFGRATSLRAALTPHERVLLDGFEPVMRGAPVYALSVARMEAALAKNPDDADFAFHLGFARWLSGDFRGAVAEMDRALAIDPHLALASRARAYLLLLLDEASQAIAEYEHCLTLSPAATSCLFGLADVQVRQGDCLGAEASARRLIAIAPASPNGYSFLARSLTEQHQDEAASLAIDEYLRRLAPETRGAQQASFETRRAVLRGDFVAAERALRAWELALKDVTDEGTHFAASQMRMELALETGRPRDAREAGSSFLARQPALTGAALHSDVRLLVLGTMHRAGGVSSAVLDALREEARTSIPNADSSWRAREQAQDAWISAYALSVASPDEARGALAMLPQYPALRPEVLRDPVELDGLLGRVLLLAEKPAEALAPLSRAARSCFALDAPLFQTQIMKLLADAELAEGDRSQACAYYGEVIRRWGSSTLPSETARTAKAAFARIHCDAH